MRIAGPILVIAASLTATCAAQWSQVPEINNLVCDKTNEQKALCAIPDGYGGTFVVWEDSRNSANGVDLYAQRLSASGATVWSASGIEVCGGEGAQRRPSLAPDGAGGVIVVWDDTRNVEADIYAQRIDSSGRHCWSPTGVPVCIAPWAQQYPQVVTDGAGGAIVFWQDGRTPGYDVYAQRLSASGAALWTDNGLLVSGTSRRCILSRALPDGRGGAIAVWEDGRNPQNGGDLYAQRVNDAGATVWPPSGVPVCTAGSTQRAPRMVSDDHEGAIIAWQDARGGALSDVYAQRIDSAGQARWLTNGIGVCLLPEQQGPPEIASDLRGGAIISWRDERFSYAPRLYAQRVNAAGNALWQADGIDVCPAAQFADKHRMVSDGAGGMIAAWQDGRGGSTNLNIFAQRVDSNGVQLCGATGILVAGAYQNQHDVCLLPAFNQGCIALWEDERNSATSTDIFASYVYQCRLIPVELQSFDAAIEGDRVALRWVTASEDNNAGFTVLRSFDGRAWHPIGAVPGNGTTRGRTQYGYVDPMSVAAMPAGSVFYRLRQTDFDGSARESHIVEVRTGGMPAHPAIEAFPNPAAAAGSIVVSLPSAGALRLELRDALGRVVATLARTECASGAHSFPFDASPFAAGMYFLLADTPGGIAVRPLSIAR
ncbi:MAG: hypothetical protein IPP94_15285 [Ignavibacteria bacterium]|nr:hypothetical protein [Ignavibacteria bacterium]